MLTLEDVVQMGLANSPVFRELGGRIVQFPETALTILGPAIAATDTIRGPEAALAAFDAQVSATIIAEKNDRALNNEVLVGTNFFQQDLTTSTFEISKTAATGGRFAFREFVEYNANNAPRNLFGSTWTTWMDFEVRQPIGQGAGVAFNRLAGPNAIPGQINGVLVARATSDISLIDFEIGIRNLVSNLENTYWDLYFAYRNLEATIAARDRALLTWQEFKKKQETGADGGVGEAQAREQYYRFQEDVQTSLSGRVLDGTQTFNGSSGGTFRGINGVLVAERRLRLLMGIPINDDTLIRPAYDPSFVRVVFGWEQSLNEVLTRRAELRRQRTILELRNMELAGNRNFLQPKVELVRAIAFAVLARICTAAPAIARRWTTPSASCLAANIRNGNWASKAGCPSGFGELTTPCGMQSSRSPAQCIVLREQERSIVHNLSNAFGELERSYATVETAFNRRKAAEDFLQTLDTRFKEGIQVDANLLLDAQRRLADAEIRYFQALSEYVIAVKNVHFEKGSLMEYNEVHLVDRPPMTSFESSDWLRGSPQFTEETGATQPGATQPGATESYEQPGQPIQDAPLETLPQQPLDLVPESLLSPTQDLQTSAMPDSLTPRSPAVDVSDDEHLFTGWLEEQDAGERDATDSDSQAPEASATAPGSAAGGAARICVAMAGRRRTGRHTPFERRGCAVKSRGCDLAAGLQPAAFDRRPAVQRPPCGRRRGRLVHGAIVGFPAG